LRENSDRAFYSTEVSEALRESWKGSHLALTNTETTNEDI